MLFLTCLLHHLQLTFLVQLLLRNSLSVVQFQRSLGILSYVRSCPDCSGVCSFSFVCHWPTHPLVGSLVPAACSWLSRSTGCQHTNRRLSSTARGAEPIPYQVTVGGVRDSALFGKMNWVLFSEHEKKRTKDNDNGNVRENA